MDSTTQYSAPKHLDGVTSSLSEGLVQPIEELAQQGKEKAGQLADQVKEGIHGALTDQKGRAADTLGTVAESLNEASDRLKAQGNPALGSYLQHGQQAVDSLSSYLRDAKIEDIADDLQGYARRNPTLVVGALFAVGFLAGRFLRSSAPGSSTKAMAVYTPPTAPRDRFDEQRSW